MTREQLRAVGAALYGAEWQSALARALGVNPRTVRKLASGEMAVSASMEAAIGRLTGAGDPLDLDRAWPRDEWVLGDGAEVRGRRREYLVHTRRPRFVARVAATGGEPELEYDAGAGVCYASEDYVLCEIAWIDPPPGPAALAKLMEAACDAVDAAG